MTFKDNLRDILAMVWVGGNSYSSIITDTIEFKDRDVAKALSAITKLVEGLIGEDAPIYEGCVYEAGYNRAKSEIHQRLRG